MLLWLDVFLIFAPFCSPVVVDNSGHSKGYGFLKFGSEEEMKHCLQNMNGYTGLGSKAVKVSSAVPKGSRGSRYSNYVCTSSKLSVEYWLSSNFSLITSIG